MRCWHLAHVWDWLGVVRVATQLQVVGTKARMESGGRTIDSTLGLLVATFTQAFRLLPVPPGALYHHYLDHVRACGQKAVAALSGTMRSVQVRGVLFEPAAWAGSLGLVRHARVTTDARVCAGYTAEPPQGPSRLH